MKTECTRNKNAIQIDQPMEDGLQGQEINFLKSNSI